MKLKYLKFWDILIITIIMLGPAIWNSTQIFFTASGQPEQIVFTTQDNIRAICIQSAQLMIALAYLWLRKFDFSNWKFKITIKHTIYGIGIFFLLGFLMDLLNIAMNGWGWMFDLLSYNTPFLTALSEVTFSVVIFSLLNGFYEEIFFLGICTAVKAEHQNYAFIYALIIRFIFHTYQGIIPALGIGLILGIIYYFLYKKKTENLYPYMFSHTLADIFGISLIHFL